MSLTQEQLLSEALALDPAQRAALAESLWLSVDQATQEGIGAAWATEIRRRIDEFDAGRAGARPVEESIDRLRRKAGL